MVDRVWLVLVLRRTVYMWDEFQFLIDVTLQHAVVAV